MRDVIKISRNANGKDFVIGDVHGGKSAFEAVLKMLQTNDRLFLVGDLIDRGEDSAAIIELIQRQNKNKMSPQTYVAKGNHEVLFLDAIDYLNKSSSNGYALLNFLVNGGEWIYSEKTTHDYIKNNIQQLKYNPREIQPFLTYLQDKSTRADLTSLAAFIKELPYAIQTGESNDPRSFVVCHADMPLSDSALCEIANGDGKVSGEDKNHMIWARPPKPNSKEPVIRSASSDGRQSTSMVDYSGHNAMYNAEQAKSAIRSDTNTVNLDFGAFENGFVMVNHTDRTAQVVTASDKKAPDFLARSADAISQHLQVQFTKRLGCMLDDALSSNLSKEEKEKFQKVIELISSSAAVANLSQEQRIRDFILTASADELKTLSKNIFNTKEEFANARAETPPRTDFKEAIFTFSDFEKLNLNDCQFHGLSETEALETVSVPAASTNNVSAPLLKEGDSDFVEVGESPSKKSVHAVFLMKPDFSGATLSSNAFLSNEDRMNAWNQKDAVNALFPQGYKNDNGRLNPAYLDDCRLRIAESGGLAESQICAVIEHMNVEAAASEQHEVMQLENKSIAYTAYSSEKGAVINVERILSLSDDQQSTITPEAISAQKLGEFFQKLSKERAESRQHIDCIQIPVKLEAYGRKHYVELLIYKNNDQTIAAKIIDSTNNPVGMDGLKNAAKKMLEQQKESVANLLGSNQQATVQMGETMHTGVQPSFGDKHCGVYVMAGTRAITNAVLTDGATLLNDDKASKKTVQNEHYHVKQGYYLQQNCDRECLVKKPKTEKTAHDVLTDLVDNKLTKNPENHRAFVEAVKLALGNYEKKHKGFFDSHIFHSSGTGHVARLRGELDKLPVDSGKGLQMAKIIAKEILLEGLMKHKTEERFAIKTVNSRTECLMGALKEKGFFSSGSENTKGNIIKLEDISDRKVQLNTISNRAE